MPTLRRILKPLSILLLASSLFACGGGGGGSSSGGNTGAGTGTGTDSTPDAFTFVDVTGATISSTVTSNAITVAGIDTAADISITGGSYSINSGAFTTDAGTVSNGDTVQVQVETDLGTVVTTSAVLTIGGVADTFSATTFDTLPDNILFTDQIEVGLNTTVVSNDITVSGIQLETVVSISGGEYSINGGAFTSADGTINNGDEIRVQVVSSNVANTTVSATLSLGLLAGLSTEDTFDVTTVAVVDTTPNAFDFVDVTGATIDSIETSNTVTIFGINVATPISVTGGRYSIDGGAFTFDAGTITNGQTVQVEVETASGFVETTSVVLTVGDVSVMFSATTFDTLPDPFGFTDVSDADLFKTFTSNSVTVSGINQDAVISISGDSSAFYSINGATATQADGMVSNGDTVQVFLLSSRDLNTSVSATLSIGLLAGLSTEDTFEVTTKAFIPFSNFQEASVVIGQTDFTGGTSNQGGAVGANTLDGPYGNVLYAIFGNRLYIPDTLNRRILGFNGIPSVNNEDANFVMGQDDFTSTSSSTTAKGFSSPQTVVGDGFKTMMADFSNNRVLLWNSVPSSNLDADVVVGQDDFTSAAPACTQSSLRNPESVAMSGNKLVVTDTNNHRVLIWNSIPTTNGEPADIVLGQSDFTSCTANAGGISGSSLAYPAGVWTDGTRLVVLDSANNRALIWTSFPTSNGQAADIVIGQANFTSGTANAGGISAATLSKPYIGVFSNGVQLFITDNVNHRVLIWNSFPTSNGQAADTVLGQSDFSHSTPNDDDQDNSNDGQPSAKTLLFPRGVFQSLDKLFITDGGNSRVLIYEGQ